jgi:hypothetical protein
VNTRLPWITPAQFRPELVPEELMAQGLTVSKIFTFKKKIFTTPINICQSKNVYKTKKVIYFL